MFFVCMSEMMVLSQRNRRTCSLIQSRCSPVASASVIGLSDRHLEMIVRVMISILTHPIPPGISSAYAAVSTPKLEQKNLMSILIRLDDYLTRQLMAHVS